MNEETVVQVSIDKLKIHPRNCEFFDPMKNDKWAAFVNSIHVCGILQPLIITTDYTIVSGHERYRAALTLHMSTLPCIIREYPDDDAVLLDLIETNIEQRGSDGATATKWGRRYDEIKRIYGIQHGNNQHTITGTANSATPQKTESDVAEEWGISARTLREDSQIANSAWAEVVDNGTVSAQTALGMMRKLSDDEQREVLAQLDPNNERHYTEREISEVANELVQAERRIAELERNSEISEETNRERREENTRLRHENDDLKSELEAQTRYRYAENAPKEFDASWTILQVSSATRSYMEMNEGRITLVLDRYDEIENNPYLRNEFIAAMQALQRCVRTVAERVTAITVE